MEQYNSRNADKFVVRLREGQRERMRERADTEVRSMNDLAVAAIDRYMEQSEAFEAVVQLAAHSLECMAKNAARYQLLRQHIVDSYIASGSGEKLDAQLDEALKGSEFVLAELLTFD